MHGRNQDLLKKCIVQELYSSQKWTLSSMFNKAIDLGIMWYFAFWVEENQ